MHKLTTDRQVTLPQNVCDTLELRPGDYVEIFERDGVAHIVKMSNESLAGSFSYINEKVSLGSREQLAEALQKHALQQFEVNNDSG